MEEHVKRGYLNEDFRLFHIRDRVELELNYHYHEFDKIVVFLTGNVTYVVESKAYFLKPWDIVLVPHGQIHRPIIDTNEHYERIALWMNADYLRDSSIGGDDLRQCFAKAEEKNFALIRPDSAGRVTLMKLLNGVESAMKSKEFGHETMYRTSFLQFMVELNRISAGDDTDKNTAAFRSDPKLDEIIAHINANLGSDLSLDSIAKQFYISKSYLMHKFKETTGCSAHRYIQQKRLILAADLIREGLPVADAGARCGYGDYSAFLRAFKKLYGVNPSDVV
ncbi:MAG: AraC family transcriptional regulator [Clostridia bacterium]|nr:AraC family transcriptional regulator [Clostridia bacterium]